MSLDVAKRLFDKDQVDLIQLRVDDIYAAPQIAEIDPGHARRALRHAGLGRDEPVALLGARRSRRWPISLTIGLIVMVAALNIVASLILLVMEKHRDIAILKTMGASARSVTTIFMMQGLIIGIVGTTVGAAAGYALSYAADALPADSRADRRLSGVVRAVHGPAARLRARRRRRDPHLLRRDDLPVAPGREARSGAGAAV